MKKGHHKEFWIALFLVLLTAGCYKEIIIDESPKEYKDLLPSYDVIPNELNQPNELRKVSLRRLEAAIEESLQEKKELPVSPASSKRICAHPG